MRRSPCTMGLPALRDRRAACLPNVPARCEGGCASRCAAWSVAEFGAEDQLLNLAPLAVISLVIPLGMERFDHPLQLASTSLADPFHQRVYGLEHGNHLVALERFDSLAEVSAVQRPHSLDDAIDRNAHRAVFAEMPHLQGLVAKTLPHLEHFGRRQSNFLFGQLLQKLDKGKHRRRYRTTLF